VQKIELPLVSQVIKLLIAIVGQISKFKFKYARGVRHSVERHKFGGNDDSESDSSPKFGEVLWGICSRQRGQFRSPTG
jgi:hypothetical protein